MSTIHRASLKAIREQHAREAWPWYMHEHAIHTLGNKLYMNAVEQADLDNLCALRDSQMASLFLRWAVGVLAAGACLYVLCRLL